MRKSELKTAIELSKRLHNNVDVTFIEFIKSTLSGLEISPDDLATLVDVSPPTIKRWANGANLPYGPTRTHIGKVIRQRARRALKDLKNAQTN